VSLGQEGLYIGKLRLYQLHSIIILGHILKYGLLKSGLSLLLSWPLILHGLRPIHTLILPEALSLTKVVGGTDYKNFFFPQKSLSNPLLQLAHHQ